MNNMKFENGNEIKIIGVDVANTRSKRWQEQLQNIKDYYKHSPDRYVEEILGIELYTYQKIMLKLIPTKERLLAKFGFRRR